MKLATLQALNLARTQRKAAALVTDLESGEERLIGEADIAADPLADAVATATTSAAAADAQDLPPKPQSTSATTPPLPKRPRAVLPPGLSLAAWKQFLRVAKPFWLGDKRSTAWTLLGLLVGLMLLDTQLAYSGIKNLKLALGVKNLFDKDPPYTNYGGGFIGGYDLSYADVRGRFIYGTVQYKFF